MGADFRMRFLTTDLKVQSGTPSNGFVRGAYRLRIKVKSGAYRLRIKVKSEFDEFVTKKGREQSWEIR